MNALVKHVVENTGLIPEQAELATDTIIHYLEQQLPDPFPGLMLEVVNGGNLPEQRTALEPQSTKKLVPTVHLTGMTVHQLEERLQKEQSVEQCFICKRTNDAQTIAFSDDAEAIVAPVMIFKYKKRCGDLIYTFPICQECAWLIGIF